MKLSRSKLLRGLVAIRSLSGHEGAASSFLAGQMRRWATAGVVDQAGNAVGERGTRMRGDVRSLLGHIDTVPGASRCGSEDGRLFGRGSVDAKGPLAAFVTAAARG